MVKYYKVIFLFDLERLNIYFGFIFLTASLNFSEHILEFLFRAKYVRSTF